MICPASLLWVIRVRWLRENAAGTTHELGWCNSCPVPAPLSLGPWRGLLVILMGSLNARLERLSKWHVVQAPITGQNSHLNIQAGNPSWSLVHKKIKWKGIPSEIGAKHIRWIQWDFLTLKGLAFWQLCSLRVFGVQTQWASRNWNVQRKLSSCLLSVTVQSPYSSPSPSLGSEGLPGWLVSPNLLPFLETALCGCDSHSLSRCPLRSHRSTPISQASSHIEALTLARRCSGQLRKPRSQQFRIWYHLKHTFPESP